MKSENDLTRVREFRFILMVRDLAAQRKFYEDIFAWSIIDDWGGGVMYETGGATFELIEDPHADAVNQATRIAISVPNVNELFELIKNKVEVVFPPRHNFLGRYLFPY